MCNVPIHAILILADPRARRDCIYTQSKKEVTATSEHFLIVNGSTDYNNCTNFTHVCNFSTLTYFMNNTVLLFNV